MDQMIHTFGLRRRLESKTLCCISVVLLPALLHMCAHKKEECVRNCRSKDILDDVIWSIISFVGCIQIDYIKCRSVYVISHIDIDVLTRLNGN